MTNTTHRLTTHEQAVLDGLKRSADGNGGDFGVVEDVTTAQALRALGLTAQQVGALLTTLQAKGVVHVWAPVTTDSGRWTQVTSDHFREE